MNLVLFLTVILVLSLFLCSFLGYTLYEMFKKIQRLEGLLAESKLIMQNIRDAQKSHLESQTAKNPMVLILSSMPQDKGEKKSDEATDKTIH